ncbi:K88 minor fimbrial subunit faeJ [Escherichia coli STEC_EH250]|nr:K88 minor fimbrial subunit faeJ [Escherichia coli STEC_EH250]
MSTSKQEDGPVLNIIHRLKSGMFPALFFLTSASVLARKR